MFRGRSPDALFGRQPSTLKNRIILNNVNTVINLDAAWDFNFHWTHHFDGFDVKYVGGYSQYNYTLTQNNYGDGDTSINSYQLPVYPLSVAGPTAGNFCGYVPLVGGHCAPLTVDFGGQYRFDTSPRWFSHEVDVSSTTNGKLSWIGGAYYYNEKDDNKIHFNESQPQLNGGPGFNVINYTSAATPNNYIGTLFAGGTPSLAIYNPLQNGDTLFYSYQSLIQTVAGFGQASYKITDTLKLTGGLRYSYDHKDLQEEDRIIQMDSASLAGFWGSTRQGLT